MEIAGCFIDEEWESLSQIFSSGENVDLFQHYGDGGTPSPSFPPSDFSQESSNEALFFDHHQPFDDTNSFETMIINAGFMLPDHDIIMEEFLRSNRPLEAAEIKRKSEEHQHHKSPNKKPRNQPQKLNTKKGKKQVQDKNIIEEEINGGGNRQSCSSYSSGDDDSNALIDEKINNNSKARATRGSATDPQSLYARRRRERINERLKILQNLVPNGTKVDISTMLEEAVQYVKFLQLQIKLLSSDNMWMYAPLAYNGMDLGIYEKNICPNLRQ